LITIKSNEQLITAGILLMTIKTKELEDHGPCKHEVILPQAEGQIKEKCQSLFPASRVEQFNGTDISTVRWRPIPDTKRSAEKICKRDFHSQIFQLVGLAARGGRR
jgi:hypothetical protein